MAARPVGPYELDKVIGSGTFGTVWLSHHKLTGTRVAVKSIPRESIKGGDELKNFRREVEVLQQLDHPLIAEFFELLEDDTNFYFVMEYVENGNLLEFVNAHGELSENVARHYFCELVSAVEYLHAQMRICHRDLKAENVLLDRNHNIRLIDFGLSTRFTTENPFLSTVCGSPAYASPEMLQGKKYTASSEVWSLGVLLYAMVVGELPFSDENMHRLMRKIVQTEPRYPETVSPQLRNLLEKLFQKDPDARITLQKVKEHPWFSQHDYSKMMNKNFGVSLQWRIMNRQEDPVDSEILQRMLHYGVDCHSLAESLIGNKMTPLTAVYRMLKKEKITEQMAQVIVVKDVEQHRPKVQVSLSTDGVDQKLTDGDRVQTPKPRAAARLRMITARDKSARKTIGDMSTPGSERSNIGVIATLQRVRSKIFTGQLGLTTKNELLGDDTKKTRPRSASRGNTMRLERTQSHPDAVV